MIIDDKNPHKNLAPDGLESAGWTADGSHWRAVCLLLLTWLDGELIVAFLTTGATKTSAEQKKYCAKFPCMSVAYAISSSGCS